MKKKLKWIIIIVLIIIFGILIYINNEKIKGFIYFNLISSNHDMELIYPTPITFGFGVTHQNYRINFKRKKGYMIENYVLGVKEQADWNTRYGDNYSLTVKKVTDKQINELKKLFKEDSDSCKYEYECVIVKYKGKTKKYEIDGKYQDLFYELD